MIISSNKIKIQEIGTDYLGLVRIDVHYTCSYFQDRINYTFLFNFFVCFWLNLNHSFFYFYQNLQPCVFFSFIRQFLVLLPLPVFDNIVIWLGQRSHSLCDVLATQKPFVCLKEVPKQSLCSLLASEMLDIASNSALRTSCAISGTSVADTRKW